MSLGAYEYYPSASQERYPELLRNQKCNLQFSGGYVFPARTTEQPNSWRFAMLVSRAFPRGACVLLWYQSLPMDIRFMSDVCLHLHVEKYAHPGKSYKPNTYRPVLGGVQMALLLPHDPPSVIPLEPPQLHRMLWHGSEVALHLNVPLVHVDTMLEMVRLWDASTALTQLRSPRPAAPLSLCNSP